MRVLQFDSLGGASGDMILAALIDAGASRDRIASALSGLKVERFDIRAEAIALHGMKGTRVEVVLSSENLGEHREDDSHSPRERGLNEITALIENARLPERARNMSVKTFQRLAEAEAKVHGVNPEQVHFHEVGALDSIVDIVGSCLALDMLDVQGVSVGPLPLGSGVTTCSHGTIPIPVPATLELLKGMRVIHTDEPFELVTPTGAALLSTWKSMDSPPAGCRILSTGCGFGHRDLQGRPNMIRAILLDAGGEAAPRNDECLVLECNLDDCSPELLGSLADRLMAGGALDVFTTPVFMKKQRPAVLLTVLCASDRKEEMLDLMFRESTTFGVREYPVRRTVLHRRIERVTTAYGIVRMKIGIWKEDVVTRSPEHEDCARLAADAGIPVRAVYEAALRAAQY